MRRHFLTIQDQSPDDLRDLVDLSLELKRAWQEPDPPRPFDRLIIGLVFEKPSLRTRVSFEVAMRQLGGHALYLSPQEVEMGKRESIPDVARVLSRYVNGIVVRTFGHSRVNELAEYATVPVINGLSDFEHPCQALADVLTIREHRGALPGVRLAYVGDGNNVCRSLMLAATKLGMHLRIASPNGYQPSPDAVDLARRAASESGGSLLVTNDPREAVRGADVVYTDVWTSMGQERESAERRTAFAGFQVNLDLMRLAGDAVVMHDLPAHRGEEITDDVMESDESIVFDQAENRMHAQKAVLWKLLRS